MNNKVAVGAAALASAALASVCCLGPLVVTGLGLGGLGLAAGLTRYRPLFLAATGLVLAVGFYRAYRKRSVACADGSCELRSSGPKAKAALWALTALAAAVAAFPDWSAWALKRGSAAVPAGGHVISLQVSGMDCAACTMAIRKSVEKVPGVRSARIDFDARSAAVVADAGTDPKAVVDAVAAAGYKAVVLGGGDDGESRR